MISRIPRILLAGGSSGSGKTTLTCALLAALRGQGLDVAAFKCGPDFIDPMFHSLVSGRPSRNLDIFLCGEETVKYLLAKNAQGSDLAVLEGVMGLYDGMAQDQYGSSNHVAMLTETPTVLVVNGDGQSLSLAAQICGFLKFRPNTIKGVVFNGTSEKMYHFYSSMLENELELKSYGFLPKLPGAGIGSRHLGLVTPAEIADVNWRLEEMGRAAGESLDLKGLLEVGRSAGPLAVGDIPVAEQGGTGVTIAVAHDRAFCFYYEDSLDLLRQLGARLEFFSPLHDSELPAGACGLLLGGGYPEEHAAALSANTSMLHDIRDVARGGLPIFAECGGFMYLSRGLTDRQGSFHPMLGIIDAEAHMTTSLKRFGYITLTAESDTLFARRGDSFNAHEFHYSDTSDNGSAFMAVKSSGASWPCIHVMDRIFVGYPHMHFWGAPELARAFINVCAQYKKETGI